MLVATSVATDARVLREASTLAEAGYEVRIVGKDVPPGTRAPAGVVISTATAGTGLRRRPDSLTERSLSRPRRVARWLLLPEHRNRSFGTWARQAELVATGLGYDVVHAHDFTALAVGDRLAKTRGVPLVYDAHELWFERQRSGRPTPVQRRCQQRAEKRLGARAAAVLTVGEGLAAKLRATYGWNHVTVVRNTFPPSSSPGLVPAPAMPAAAVYAGRLAAGRDLETVAATSRLVTLPVRLLGPADKSWSARFNPGRCTVASPVAVDDVDVALRAGGLALVTLSDQWGNHRIALPNKLFQAVRARVPVIASDVGELGRMVRDHRLGVLYRPGDPASLAAAVEEAVARYPELCASVKRAGEELSWHTDREVLLAVYDELTR